MRNINRFTKKAYKSLMSLMLTVVMIFGGVIFIPGAALIAQAEEEPIPAYLDTSLSYKERAADMVSRMSLREKELQLIPSAPAIPRLGLSAYKYQNEALHGLMSNDGGVSFPSPITTASSWNPELMKDLGKIVSDEIRAFYNATPGRGLSYYSPTMNLMRDPRWGRNEESYSEDPFVTAVFGEMFVKGMQGTGDGITNQNPGAEYGTDYVKVIPTIKHYAANNSEKNRNSGTYDVDNKTLRDYYTWAFQRIVEKTNVSSLMSAYNRINGFPCSANEYLLTTLLRKTFGFTGFVVNDCGAINDTILNHKWVPPGWDHVVTIEDAVALSIKSGNNMDCGGGSMDTVYDDYTSSAVEKGKLTEDEIDANLIEILVQRFKTGEFDGLDNKMSSYKDLKWSTPVENNYNSTRIPESKDNIAKTVEAGMQGAVLLKNDNNALPIKASDTNIKVFGPLARCWDLGDYSGWPKSERVNFRQGMQLVGTEKGKTVDYWEGMTYTAPSSTSNMVQVRAIGFYPGAGIRNASSGTDVYNLSKSGNNLTNVQDGSYIRFPALDLKLMSSEEFRVYTASNNNFSVNAEFHLDSPNGSILGTVLCLPTGSNTITGTLATSFVPITSSNRLTIASGFSSKVSSESGKENEPFTIDKFNRPLWDFARGENNGIHDIYVTFSYDRTPTLNETQLANASNPGVSVVYIGTATANARNESNQATFGAYRVCNEASDRPNLKFPAGQDILVNEIASRTKAAGGRTIVMIQAVGVMDVSAFVDNVDAIVWTAYNGMRQGEADARVLFGDYNPSGHLTQTWYTDDTQLYSYPNDFLWDYSIDNRDGKAGRTYMYFNGTPRYPFGYGLSYTNFTISNMTLTGPTDGVLTVTADVKNNGAIDGAEVVQAYVKAPGAGNGVVPKQELKGFARVEVPAGQTRTATIKIELKDLATIDPGTIGTVGYGFNHGRRVLTPGNYEIVVGYDSATPAASKTVTLTELPQKLKVVTLKNAKPIVMAGDTISSDVTICMTDETFLDKNAAGLTITYSSSNTAVATVDTTGHITAINGGTALIKATFNYNGQIMTADYPVVVLNMASLNEVWVDGAPLTSFRYNRFDYSFKLPPCSTYAIPEITYTSSPGSDVVCTPAQKIPGKTVIEVSRGSEIVTYQFSFTYEDVDLQGVDKTLMTHNYFVAQGPRSTSSGPGGNDQMYFDWRNVGPVSSSSARFDLLNYSNREGLYLTFTIDLSAEDMTRPFSQVMASGSPNCIRLRDSNSTERNFGWRPTSQWNLKWGKNYVRIPLAPAMARTITNNSDRTVPTSEYMITVNGAKVQAVECNMGAMNWADVYRMLMYINISNNYYVNNKMTMALEDVKFIDAGINLSNINENVATFNSFASSRFPLYATSTSNQMYADWTNVDSSAVNIKGNAHKESLYLSFTMSWHSTNEQRPFSSLTFTNGSNAVKLRSPDATKAGSPSDSNPPSMTEHNFGWRINAAWASQMHWGDNKIRIPLGTVVSNALPSTNVDTNASNYQINVNGVNVAARECHLGWIDWTDVRRIIMTIWPGGIVAGETISLEIKDAKILDDTAAEQTATMRTNLTTLMTPKIAQGSYTSASYKEYLAAYDKASKIKAIADWPTALMCAILSLQAAIDGLVVSQDDLYTADFNNSSANIWKPTAGSAKGNAIAAVYNKNGALERLDIKPFDVPSGTSSIINFGFNFKDYPASEYDYKVFFWDDSYVPLAPAVVS